MTARRYSRQTLFNGIGEKGQERIRKARVAVVGCGALGTANAEMLTRAGVGRLDLIDRDFVEESNLQRQTLFCEADVKNASPKAVAASTALRSINSEVDVQGHVTDLIPENIETLCARCDLIIDGTDNFDTRYLINDWAWKRSIPWVYGGCVGSGGVAFAFQPGKTPCLQCLFPEAPAPGSARTCDTAGIIAPTVHVVASYQVTQALKLICGLVAEGMLQFDIWDDNWHWSRLGAQPDPNCRCCGGHDFRFLHGEGDRLVRLCGRNAVQVSPATQVAIDFQRLAERIGKTGQANFNEYMMRIDVDGYEIALFPDGRSIIKGTDDPLKARSVYARYIGR